MTQTFRTPTPPRVVIIGAGFGGIAMGTTLLRSGHTNFVIVEQSDGFGGVWRDNTYPGAACDVPSPLYSLSYAQNPDWPKLFSEQPDILAYLERTAQAQGLTDKVRFGTTVTAARFDPDQLTWTLTLSDGSTMATDILVTAVGQLSRPAIPTIPGLDTFDGASFHSARWDHSVDLRGKKVAVIGTGASAIQFVPRIQPQVGELELFQRSAAWILPKPDLTYRDCHRRLLSLPGLRSMQRLGIFAAFETLSVGLVDLQQISGTVEAICRNHLRRQVADPSLRAVLTPDYALGCKRGLFSNDFYPALTQPNVTVTTDQITGIAAGGITTADGALHECDVIIFGTGFQAQDPLAHITVTGRDDRTLAQTWSAGPAAHLGVAVHGFPNLLLMYGPNTNLGAGSIVYMLEAQARYIASVVADLTTAPGTALEVRAEVQHAFNEGLQTRLRRSVWTKCSSWYTDANGRITTNWPGTPLQFRTRLGLLDHADYRRLMPRGAGHPEAVKASSTS